LAIFLSISQQGVSADIIQNSAVGNFSPKTEGTMTKAAIMLINWFDFMSLLFLSFPFL
jgi:hypothetical protein